MNLILYKVHKVYIQYIENITYGIDELLMHYQ